MLKMGKFKGTLHVWQKGLDDWQPIESLNDFHALLEGHSEALTRSEFKANRPPEAVLVEKNTRSGARIHLLATVWKIAEGDLRIRLGVCADISITGLQVLLDTDEKFKVEDRFDLEIKPGGNQKFKPFWAKVVVRWIKPETKRMGVEFQNLLQDAHESLVKLIHEIEAPKQIKITRF